MSENKKYKISVGIPTYEASSSLAMVLHSIYNQTVWDQIVEVVVVVDGKSHISEDILQKIANHKLKLSYYSKQEGQSARINNIVQIASGDLLVLTNDDVILKSDAIEKISKSWQETGAGLLAGHVMPLPAKSYVEKILEIQNKLIYKIVEMLNGENNYLVCNGRLIALSSNFSKKINLPTILKNNDAYIYVSSRIKNIKFTYVPDAICYFRNPSRLKEYFKQSIKFQDSLMDNIRFFTQDISVYYKIPKYILVKAFLSVFISSPVKSLNYLVFKFYAWILSIFRKKSATRQSGIWETDKSTKIINKLI